MALRAIVLLSPDDFVGSPRLDGVEPLKILHPRQRQA
jgi:hypothetical protein